MKQKLDEAQQHHKGHFFVSSVAEWRTGRDPAELIKAARVDDYPFHLWFVPLDKDANYEIEFYAPKVEGAVLIGTYGFTQHGFEQLHHIEEKRQHDC